LAILDVTAFILQFVISALVVVVAGTFLTRYADQIGEHTGLGRTLAGALLLATATSLPELTVDCHLAHLGQADLVLGDLFGSSLINLLILAVLDLCHRAPTRIFSPLAAAHALSAIMAIILTSISLLFLLARFEFTVAGVGPGPIVVVIAYLFGSRLLYFDQKVSLDKAGAVASVISHGARRPTLRQAIIGYLAATTAIFVAAPFLASAAEGLAVVTGLGGTFIGTTLVALSTSTPEAVTTLAAVRARAFDLAVGNIFGSNAFNMIIFLPADLFFDGSILSAASPTHAVTAACVIIATCVATLGLLYRAEKRYWIIEPDALLVIFLVLASLGLVYILR
jgi:cation:H+ antiporter